jgi:hypothetical protein
LIATALSLIGKRYAGVFVPLQVLVSFGSLVGNRTRKSWYFIDLRGSCESILFHSFVGFYRNVSLFLIFSTGEPIEIMAAPKRIID